MVHYPNALIEVAGKTVTKNAEGTKISEYDFENPVESFRADVQPNALTQYQIDLYGINEKNAETKKIFYTSAQAMKSGNRARVTFDDGSVGVYTICPENKWRVHCEALLVPVENEG